MTTNGTSEDTKIVIESTEIELVGIENGIYNYTLFITLKKSDKDCFRID